ncbi:MAG: hypothetical protein AAB229_09480 [Candidatus Hydrogenedentota bacterium]
MNGLWRGLSGYFLLLLGLAVWYPTSALAESSAATMDFQILAVDYQDHSEYLRHRSLLPERLSDDGSFLWNARTRFARELDRLRSSGRAEILFGRFVTNFELGTVSTWEDLTREYHCHPRRLPDGNLAYFDFWEIVASGGGFQLEAASKSDDTDLRAVNVTLVDSRVVHRFHDRYPVVEVRKMRAAFESISARVAVVEDFEIEDRLIYPPGRAESTVHGPRRFPVLYFLSWKR